VLDGLAASALLAYLAVAHHGRGRGDWTPSEYPAHWPQVVGEVLGSQRSAWTALWAGRGQAHGQAALLPTLNAQFTEAARAVLARLYPDAAPAPSSSANTLS